MEPKITFMLMGCLFFCLIGIAVYFEITITWIILNPRRSVMVSMELQGSPQQRKLEKHINVSRIHQKNGEKENLFQCIRE